MIGKRLSEWRKNRSEKGFKLNEQSWLMVPSWNILSAQPNEWASESEINKYYDGNDNNTTANQWKITIITITTNDWMRHGVLTHLHSETLDWTTVRKYIENKQSLMDGELFYNCCCRCDCDCIRDLRV